MCSTKHFQNSLHVSKAQSALVQGFWYAGYFLLALPAGMFARRHGYRGGILFGLSVIALGCICFVPVTKLVASQIVVFSFFLLALGLVACGFTFIETIANPYATVLGAPESGVARINLAQSCNAVGWIFGPPFPSEHSQRRRSADDLRISAVRLPLNRFHPMLHDPSHRPQPITTEEIKLQPDEKEALRRLVAELAQVAALPVHREKAELWRRLNDLESARPMVWINEIPWHEMNVNDELTLRTRHPWAREWETTLRQTLYQWRHLPADMIVSDFIECPLAIHSTDFGIVEDVDLAKTDEANPIVSRHFNTQIRDWPDLEKVQMPRVNHVVAAKVYLSPHGGCTDAVVEALGKVRATVLVQASSFASAHIANALVEAHRRRVEVDVVLDSRAAPRRRAGRVRRQCPARRPIFWPLRKSPSALSAPAGTPETQRLSSPVPHWPRREGPGRASLAPPGGGGYRVVQAASSGTPHGIVLSGSRSGPSSVILRSRPIPARSLATSSAVPSHSLNSSTPRR